MYNQDDNLLISTQISEITSSMKEGQKIGIIPGLGGAEFAFKKLIDKGCILYGFELVHSISKLKEYGKSVYQLGRKHKIETGSIPESNVLDTCDFIEGVFNIPCVSLPNYLSVSLTPSNTILNTSIFMVFVNKEYLFIV